MKQADLDLGIDHEVEAERIAEVVAELRELRAEVAALQHAPKRDVAKNYKRVLRALDNVLMQSQVLTERMFQCDSNCTWAQLTMDSIRSAFKKKR